LVTAFYKAGNGIAIEGHGLLSGPLTMSGIFNVSLTGLNAAQAGLNTTSHNITNASVSGYTRQETEQGTTIPIKKSSGFYGQGTKIETIKRVYSEFLNNQVLSANSSVDATQVLYDQISQLDNILGDDTAGLNTALQGFFKGVSEVAATPSDVSARQSMLSQSESLVARFRSLEQNVAELQSGVETQISQSVGDINALAKQISQANLNIVKAQAGSGHPANDLLDARDELITKLSKLVRVSTLTDAKGVTSVSIGTGQSLVEGINAYRLTTLPSATDSTQASIGIELANGNVVTLPNDTITGGKLGGILNARTQLDMSQNSLGRIATGLTTLFNSQNKLGQDLSGAMGGNFFVPAVPTVQNLPNTQTGVQSTASVSGTITSVGGLTTDDYILAYDGSNYTMTNALDGTVVYSGASLPGPSATRVSGTSLASVSVSTAPNASGAAQESSLFFDGTTYTVTAQGSGNVLYSDTIPPTSLNGMLINISGTMSAGDRFLLKPSVEGMELTGSMSTGDQVLIQPTKNAAKYMTVAIKDTSLIAAASPVVVSAAKTNSGSGMISQPVAASLTGILAPASGHIATPIRLIFNAASNQFTVTGATPATIAFNPSTDAAGSKVTLNNPNLSFSVSGRPADGDVFTIDTNTKGSSDSSNANALYSLMSSKDMQDGTTTFEGSYTQLVGIIGTTTNSANINLETQKSLLDSAVSVQQSVSGVNLDEEAAKLLEYQQAYQASARCISVAQTLFDDIISIMR
jgi:flagellar hook-associated protein 1